MAPVNKKKQLKNPKKENVEIKTETAVSGQLLKKIEKKEQKKNLKKERGVVLIKHLPHGFFEEQLKNYFEQFGKVTRLRLVRSRKTGGSKGFAFVEFEYPEVAQVAADTMDNYLMFQKLVKAAYIPPDKQLYNYFKTTVRKVKNKAGKPIFVSNKTASIKRKVNEHDDWTEDKIKQSTNANLKKIKNLNEKYAYLGLDFSTICMGAQSGNSEDVEKPLPKKQKAKDESLALEDLLGATIQEDSADEDWQGSDISEDEYASSLYIDDDDDEHDSENELNPSEEIKPVVRKSARNKATTVSKADFEKSEKRKQNFGGIQKKSKKVAVKPTPLLPKQAKNAEMVKMVKQVAKPLAKINNKPKSLKKNK